MMRGDDNTVTRFQCKKCFEDSSGGRIRRRDNCTDQAERLGNFPDTVCFVFFYDAAGFCITVGIVNVFRSKVVFDHLVFNNTHMRFVYGSAGQRNAGFIRSGGSSKKDFIHLFLRVVCIFFLGSLNSGNFGFQRFNGINNGIFFVHLLYPPLLRSYFTKKK